VHSLFVIFTSYENTAHFTLVKISHYEFGSTLCIPYLIPIVGVLVMHAGIFMVFTCYVVHELLPREDHRLSDVSLLRHAVVIALISVA